MMPVDLKISNQNRQGLMPVKLKNSNQNRQGLMPVKLKNSNQQSRHVLNQAAFMGMNNY
jgi:hypothetical protein